jgi:hypothetical protein
LKRLAARILLALLVGLLSGELFLQAAALVVRSVSARAGNARASGQGETTILCVGDSHTYGLPLPAAESYPAQLEARLGERHPERAFRVVNLGIPGMNSGYLLNRLERQMLQLRPQLVVVWVGVNNDWNARESSAEGGPGRTLREALLHLRLFRLASIAWYTRTGHQYDASGRGGWFEGELPPSNRRAGGDAGPGLGDPAPGLAADLERIVALTRALDTPVVFLTYPMRKQRPLNRVIEQVAFEHDVPAVDVVRDFERAVGRGHEIPSLIDTSAGPHPTGLLYGYVVESLLPVVEAQLGIAAASHD